VNALNKIILRTAVEGFVWTMVVFCYGLGIFAMAFPSSMAAFYNAVDNRKLGAMYHERVYQRNPTAENLYLVLHSNTIHGNDAKIIKYGKKLFDETEAEEYKKVIDDVNRHLRARANGNYWELALGCNEDDRLRRAYIEALVRKGHIDVAREVFGIATDPENIKAESPSYAIFALGTAARLQDKKRFKDYYNEFSILGYGQGIAAEHFIDNVKDTYMREFGEQTF